MLSLVAHHSSSANMPHNNNFMFGGASVEPSQLEVDYDVNITTLYEAICNCDWDLAVESVRKNPQEARTWVVRHYQDEDIDASGDDDEEKEIMWRFLPIHSACARDPPAFVISALLKAYSDGAHCVDDQGMYALHYACGNQASREVIRLLLVANSMAAKCADPRGMLPIHYLACWGPSSVSIIDMVMVANRDVGNARDNDGNTPLDLAMEGDYPERNQVVVVLKRWLEKSNRNLTPTEQDRKKSLTPTRALARAGVGSAPTTPVPAAQEEEEEEEEPVQEEAKDEEEHPADEEPEQEPQDDDDDDAPQEEYPEEQEEDDAPPPPPPQQDPVGLSPRLAVNTAIDDQVEVEIGSSPLSQMQPDNQESDIENENEPAVQTRSIAEEKESLSFAAQAAMPSPRTVSRLRQEVTKLRMEKNQSEADWERKLKTSVEVLDAKCNEMVAKVKDLEVSLAQAHTKITTLQEESDSKDQIILDTEHQLSDALDRIQSVEQEYQERVAMAQQETEDVKQELSAMEMENVKLAKEIDNRNERLYSLTASIETMMERQEAIMQSVNDKNAQLTEASQARRQNLKMLFDMEQEFMEAIMGDDETLEFEKQMKEMEAMTAVIATMKD